MKHMFGLSVLIISLLAAAGQDTGAVQGKVVSDDNQPVAHVKVQPVPEYGAYMGEVPSARTNDQGNFDLRNLMPGEHRLFPVYTEGGYPDGSSGIFAGDPSLYTEVNVVPGQTVTNVILKMPKKGARFRAHILDSDTGKPVLAARIRITRPDLSEHFFEGGPGLHGDFQIVLTNKPFRVEIRANGYKTWTYSEVDVQGKQTPVLLLESGAEKEVTVSLQRLK